MKVLRYELGSSPLRAEMDNVMDFAAQMINLVGDDLGFRREVEARVVQSLGRIAGIEAPESVHNQADYRCTHYVFGAVKREPWALPAGDLTERLSSRPLGYLKERGYVLTFESERVAGDVVAYTDAPHCQIDNGEAVFRHYGVLLDGDRVQSKFGKGLILNHPIDVVPFEYGSAAYFLTKSQLQPSGQA